MVQVASTLRYLSLPDVACEQDIKVDLRRSNNRNGLSLGIPRGGESGEELQQVLLDLLLVLGHHGGGNLKREISRLAVLSLVQILQDCPLIC